MLPIRLLLCCVLLAGCEAEAPCPEGTLADEGRAGGLVAAARGTEAGKGLARPRICFGGGARGTVRPDAVVVLADGLAQSAAVARLVHMQMHLKDSLHKFPIANVPCDRQVFTAMAAEARAIVAEIEVCAQLGCDPAPYSFAGEVLAAASTERSTLVMRKVGAETQEDGLDVLIGDYRRRCEAR